MAGVPRAVQGSGSCMPGMPTSRDQGPSQWRVASSSCSLLDPRLASTGSGSSTKPTPSGLRSAAQQPGGDAPGSPTDPLGGGGGRHRPAPGLTRRLPRRSGVQGLLGDVEATPWALRAGTPRPGPGPGPGCAAPRWWAGQAADQLGDVGSPPRSGSQLPTGHQSLALGNTGACARPAVP